MSSEAHESPGEGNSNPPSTQPSPPPQKTPIAPIQDQQIQRLLNLGYEPIPIPPSGNPEDDPPFVPGVFRKTSARRLVELRIMLLNPEFRAKQGRNIARVIENIESGEDADGFYQNGEMINFQEWDYSKGVFWFEGQLRQ